eukprot:1160969-Pelagomonas_calceolata.AAC.1
MDVPLTSMLRAARGSPLSQDAQCVQQWDTDKEIRPSEARHESLQAASPAGGYGGRAFQAR